MKKDKNVLNDYNSEEENELDNSLILVKEDEEDDGKIKIKIYYSKTDDTYLKFTIYEDKIVVENNDTGEHITTATFSSTKDKESNREKINSNVSPDDYESWSSYSYMYTDTLSFGGFAEDFTINVITGLISNFWVGLAASTVLYLANKAKQDNYSGYTAKVYWSINYHCNILYRERYDFYPKDSNTLVKTEYRGEQWQASPYDYSQPAECRVLVNRYPY